MDISVFVRGQDHLAEPAKHVTSRKWMKLALASHYVRRVGQNAIQIVNDWTWKDVKEYVRTGLTPFARSTYIPEKMPPREVPGVFFEEPKSATWRREHRTAWQSYPQEATAQ